MVPGIIELPDKYDALLGGACKKMSALSRLYGFDLTQNASRKDRRSVC